ncbi:MAG TPA: sigma-70 family RNA polymerase sigma factor, partial [Gemmatimonadaceae bacterium]
LARSGSPLTPEKSVEERQWIARIRHGDPLAFKALYDTYSDAMFAFAYASLRSRAEAQDVVHDIFLNILKNRAAWNVDRELRSYLLRCVYNRVATLRRHLRVELASHESIARDADSPLEWAYRGSTDDPLLQAELGDALARAIDSLPPRSQQAYRLVREQALSYSAAASVMGISTHTVEVHLIRALKALRDHLASWRR